MNDNDPRYDENAMNNRDPRFDENAKNDRDMMRDQNAMNEEQSNVAQTSANQVSQSNVPVTGSMTGTMTGNSPALGWIKNDEIDELKTRWTSIQAKFVDEPRTSVEQADALVADALVRIEKTFSNHRASLAGKKDLSTEDLRIALQNYRTFLNRLLSM